MSNGNARKCRKCKKCCKRKEKKAVNAKYYVNAKNASTPKITEAPKKNVNAKNAFIPIKLINGKNARIGKKAVNAKNAVSVISFLQLLFSVKHLVLF